MYAIGGNLHQESVFSTHEAKWLNPLHCGSITDITLPALEKSRKLLCVHMEFITSK